MRVAIALNGTIINVIEAESLSAAQAIFSNSEAVDAEATGVGIGWTSDGGSWEPPPAPPAPDLSSLVDAERDRRIAAGFDFAGKRYQTRPEDRENIAGAAVAALGAMVNGAQAGDLRWHGGTADFAWIAEDNSLTPMDAQTVYTSRVQTEGRSYGQPATPGQKASMPASSDPSTLGSLQSPDLSKQPAATEGQQQVDRSATPAKQSFRDKYLGGPESGPVPGAKPEKELSTAQKIAAGAIDVGVGLVPGIGSYAGLVNAGLQLTGNKTIGQQLVGSFADGSGGGASVSRSDQGGSRNTIEAKTDEKAANDAKAAAEATTVKPAERFVSTYLRPTPREKWARV